MAQKLHIEDLVLNVLVNGDPARKKMLDLANQIKDDNAKLKEMQQHLSSIEKLMGGKGSDAYKQQAAAIKLHKESIDANRKTLKEMQDDLKTDVLTIGELKARIKDLSNRLRDIAPGTAEWKKYNDLLQETKARLKELSEGGLQTESVFSRLSKTGAGFVAILRIGWGVLQKIRGISRHAFSTINDFEQANVNLATILGQNVSNISDLTDQALKMGQTTRYSASEVTGLQTELAKLGFTKREILQMTGSVLNFATAVGSDLPESASLAGATLRMFGLRASDTDDVMSTLALSTNKSALSFSYLQTSMSIVGPVAKTFGFNVKDTTALLGTLANAGFDANSAATATRNIILNLADSSGKLAKSLGKPVTTFPELIDGLKKLDDKGVDLATTLELTDKRSVAAFNAFLSGADSAKVLRDELEDTGGVLQDIADKRMNTVEGSIASLKSAWERLILSFRNSQGTIKKTFDLLTDLVKGITPDKESDPNEITRRTASYVGSLWNMYDGHENKVDEILQTISDDEIEIERGLKNAEAKLESASGILAKRRAKKEVEHFQEGLAVMAGARQELTDRLKWEAGSYYGDDVSGSGTGGGSDDDDEKGKNSWSLQSDQGYLAAKAELTRQFNDGQIKSKEVYDDKLYQLEVSSLQARLALGKEKGAERLKIENDIQDKIMAHTAKIQKQNEDRAKKEAEEKKKVAELEKAGLTLLVATEEKTVKAAVESENKRFDEEKKKYEERKDQLANYQQIVEALELQHQNNLRKIELDAISKRQSEIEAVHKNNLARIQSENEYEFQLETTSSARKLEIQRERNKKVAEENKRYLEEQYKLLQTIVSSGEINSISLSKEQLVQYETKLNEIRKQLQEADASLENLGKSSFFSGTGDASLFGVKQSDWEAFFQNLEDGTLKAKDLQTAITGIGGMAQEGFKLASQAIQLTTAKEKKALDDYKKDQDSRKKSLEDRYKAGLMTESQYNAEVEQMEAEMQAKQEEMELKQAQRTKTMSIVESIINTALAATKALAQGGMAGIAMAAIVTALGAAQTAMIAAQPVGYAEGGEMEVKRAQDGKAFRAKVDPKRRGFVERPTVLVAEEGPEYVISAEALKNPDIRAYADTIENARKTGHLRSLKLEAVNPAAAVIGRASGGYVQDAAPSGTTTVSTDAMQEIGRLSKSVDRLNAILDAGIEAEVVMTGRNGLVRRFEEYNRMRDRGKL